MRATLRLTDPDDMDATMTLTMKLKHWKELRDQLADRWPAADLTSAISSIVTKAERHFWPDESR